MEHCFQSVVKCFPQHSPDKSAGANVAAVPRLVQQLKQEIHLDTAQLIMQQAKATAISQQQPPQNVCILDSGCNLKSFLRMDGANLGAIDIAKRKAMTARMFDMPSHALDDASQPRGNPRQIEQSNGGLVTLKGGMPLKDTNGLVVGAVGVAGGQPDEDFKCAEAAALALRTNAVTPIVMPVASTNNYEIPVQKLDDDISLESAEICVASCIRKSIELGLKMSICVVDAGGNLKHFVRMDGAMIGTIDVAVRKARTSRFFNMDTRVLGPLTKSEGGIIRGLELTNDFLVTFAGGVPLKTKQGLIVGGVGISGGLPADDEHVAKTGAEVFMQHLADA